MLFTHNYLICILIPTLNEFISRLFLDVFYQLPNGKTIWLDISDVLKLDKQDIQYLLATNSGEYVHNPFADSSLYNSDDLDLDYVDDLDIIEDVSIEAYIEFYPDDFYDDPEDVDFNIPDDN